MFFATQLLGEPGVEIIYPDPGFPIYASSIGFSGAVMHGGFPYAVIRPIHITAILVNLSRRIDKNALEIISSCLTSA